MEALFILPDGLTPEDNCQQRPNGEIDQGTDYKEGYIQVAGFLFYQVDMRLVRVVIVMTFTMIGIHMMSVVLMCFLAMSMRVAVCISVRIVADSSVNFMTGVFSDIHPFVEITHSDENGNHKDDHPGQGRHDIFPDSPHWDTPHGTHHMVNQDKEETAETDGYPEGKRGEPTKHELASIYKKTNDG
jgi:hypothetical protein